MNEGDILIHVPKSYILTLLTVLLAQTGAIIWFAANISNDLADAQETLGTHLVLPAHGNASERITRVEALVESLVIEERRSRAVLGDIRDLIKEQ